MCRAAVETSLRAVMLSAGLSLPEGRRARPPPSGHRNGGGRVTLPVAEAPSPLLRDQAAGCTESRRCGVVTPCLSSEAYGWNPFQNGFQGTGHNA